MARLLLRRPQSLRSGRVILVLAMVVLAVLVLAEVVLAVVVLAEVVVLPTVVLLDVVPYLSCSYFEMMFHVLHYLCS